MRTISLVLLLSIFASFIRPEKTISNLQKAYQEEANAVNRYELYAKKAEDEGYKQVSKLLRAIAESETFHMRNHSRILLKKNITPKTVKYKNVKVKPTRENLDQSMLISEDVMYPIFIKQAEKDDEPEAERSFVYAMTAEDTHRKLLIDAERSLGFNKIKDYYVSTLTGDIFEADPGIIPPISDISEEQYVKVE